MQLSAQHSFLPKTPTVRAAQVMDHFGIAFEQGEHQIAQGLQVPIRAGEIILFHGESGSGKSSLLRAAVDQLRQAGQSVLDLDQLVWEDRILIDLLPLELAESMRLLSACGLGEARLMLRTPRELSDGQRYRFRLAFALARLPEWIVADEFTATLDRKLARVVSYNLRKLAGKSGTGFLLATTHEDVLEDLSPDVSVKCSLNGRIEVRDEKTVARSDRGEQSGDLLNKDGRQEGPPHSRKKKHRSPASCGSPPVPSSTGRISLGGITAATSWG